MMKKLLMLALMLTVPTASLADNVKQGAIEVKGASALSFSSSSVKPDGGDKTTTSTFLLDTSAAYYVTPNIGVGLELAYDRTTIKPTGLPEVKDTMWSIGPKVVYDRGIAEKMSFFAEGMVGLTGMDNDGSKVDGWGFGLGAGVKYFFAPAFSADVGVKYQYAKLEDDASNKATANNLFVGVGFSVYLNN